MGANWGSVSSQDEDGSACWHVVPLVDMDGDAVPSAAHEISPQCQCHPFKGQGKGGWTVWQHFDPTHPRALGYDEYVRLRREAMAEAAVMNVNAEPRCNGRVN